MNSKEIVEAYDKLMERVNKLVYIPESDYARISFEDDNVVVTWPEVHSGYYDSTSIETQTDSFPVYLLEATDAEVEYYLAELKRIEAEAEKKKRAERIKELEAQERYTLAKLQEKYKK